MFFTKVVSTVVINNIKGRTIKMQRSLRQGDIPSMLLFAYGLDPYLERLRHMLEGIPIHRGELSVAGPVHQGELSLPMMQIEDTFT